MQSPVKRLTHLINRIFPTLFSRLAMIVVICLPLVYSALYLWAFWDPYHHLDQLPVAFVNLDRGGVKDGQSKNIGNELADDLKSDTTLKWVFTSLPDAEKGLEQKKYYSYILVPEDFTQSVLSADKDQPHQATLQLKTRQATNVISSTIVNRVASEVTEKLSHKVSQEYLDNIFVQSRDTLQDIKKAADGAHDLQSGLTDLQTGSHDLNEGLQTALSGGQDLYKGIVDAAAGSKSLHSGIYSASQGASDLRGGLSDAYDGAVSLRDHLKSAYSGAQTLASGTQSAYQGAATLSDGLKQAAAGAAAIDQGLKSADSGAASFSTGVNTAVTQLSTLKQGVDGVSQLSAAVQGQAQALANTSGGAAGALTQLIQDHPELAADPDVQALQQQVTALNQQSAMMAGTAAKLSATQDAVKNGFSSGAAAIGQLGTGAAQLKAGLDQLVAGGDSLAANLPKLQQGAAQLADGLNSATSGSASLATGLGQLADGATSLSTGLDTAHKGSDTLYAGLNSLTYGSSQLVKGLTDLQDGGSRLTGGLSDLSDGGQKLEDGLKNAADGSQTLYQQLNDGYEKSVGNLSQSKTEKEEPVMANPVQLNEQFTDPVNTYGTGFTPYFIPLSLWVGAMAIFFLSKMMSNAEARQYQPFRLLGETLRRYLIFGFIGVLQAVVLDTVLMKALGLSPNHLRLFFAFTILSSLLDIAIFQCLTTLFGEPAGTFIGVVLLMLQLTSSAGTYPRETIPPFFNAIAPYLPMTYVVSGLRDIISGNQINVEPVMVSFALCIVIFLLATAVLKRLIASLDGQIRSRHAPAMQLDYALSQGCDQPGLFGSTARPSSAARVERRLIGQRLRGWLRRQIKNRTRRQKE